MTTVNIKEVEKSETEEEQLTIPFGTYFIDQDYDSAVYILANTGSGICLINVSSGNRWKEPVDIHFKNGRINAEDFIKICSDPAIKQLKSVNITYEL